MFPPNKMEICSQQTKVLEAHGLIKFQLNSYMSMFQKTLIVTRVGGGGFSGNGTKYEMYISHGGRKWYVSNVTPSGPSIGGGAAGCGLLSAPAPKQLPRTRLS